MTGIGTLANAGAVIVGSMAGTLICSRLPQKYVHIAFQVFGLFTLVIGVSMALQSEHLILMVVSLVLGALIGQAVDIAACADKLTRCLFRKFSPQSEASEAANSRSRQFTEGFITASMLFCVGSMAILGAFEDGMGKTPQLLYAKSVMDGITSVALASTFGIAIAFSALPILLYQGALTFLASWIMRFMSDAIIADMTAVGGVLLIGLGLNILKVKEINVMNMLPALLVVALLSVILY